MGKKVKLNLVGLDGNAFNLLAQFRRAARKQGWSHEDIKAVIEDATSGNYDHLLCVLMEHTEPDDGSTDHQ